MHEGASGTVAARAEQGTRDALCKRGTNAQPLAGARALHGADGPDAGPLVAPLHEECQPLGLYPSPSAPPGGHGVIILAPPN